MFRTEKERPRLSTRLLETAISSARKIGVPAKYIVPVGLSLLAAAGVATEAKAQNVTVPQSEASASWSFEGGANVGAFGSKFEVKLEDGTHFEEEVQGATAHGDVAVRYTRSGEDATTSVRIGGSVETALDADSDVVVGGVSVCGSRVSDSFGLNACAGYYAPISGDSAVEGTVAASGTALARVADNAAVGVRAVTNGDESSVVGMLRAKRSLGPIDVYGDLYGGVTSGGTEYGYEKENGSTFGGEITFRGNGLSAWDASENYRGPYASFGASIDTYAIDTGAPAPLASKADVNEASVTARLGLSF